MLPKVDKTKKSQAQSKQLNLTDAISKEDQLRKKRLSLYLALGLTIGLSFIFWIYRFIFSYFSTPHPLPSISLNLPTIETQNSTDITSVLNSDINHILSNTTAKFTIAIYIKKDPAFYFNWSGNSVKIDVSSITQNIDQLQQQSLNSDGIFSSSLPQGLEVREKVTTSPQDSQNQGLIVLPDRQIYLLIKADQPVSESLNSTIGQLASTIYWDIVSSDPPTY